MTGAKPRPAKCPGCGRPVDSSAGHPWRPFCSERCKLADLGQWFAERYSIPDDADQEPEETPPPLPRQ